MQATTIKQFAPGMQLRSLFFHLILAALAAISFSCTSSEASTQTTNTRSIEAAYEKSPQKQHKLGEQAPDFTLLDLNGKEHKLSDSKGKFVVIHFATTWCPFCNAEAPYLEQLYEAYQSEGVEVYIVDVKEPKEIVQRKLQDRFHFTFPVLLDEDGSIAASYAPDGVLPDLARDEVVLASNLLIDREGNIQFYSLLDSQDFDAELLELKARLDELR